MVGQRCIDLIKQYEGFSAKSYICPAGYLTIGYGHVIQKGEKFTTITEKQAVALLMRDLPAYEQWVGKLISEPLTQNQFDALTSFVYNLGPHRLKTSTLRKRINDGLHWLVPDELRKWVYGGGKRLNGLVARREAEAQLYSSASRTE